MTDNGGQIKDQSVVRLLEIRRDASDFPIAIASRIEAATAGKFFGSFRLGLLPLPAARFGFSKRALGGR
jgi:hypothetical protein